MESVRKRDGRSLDHKALEDIRIQAVQRVEAGEAPSAVMRVMGFARTVIYDGRIPDFPEQCVGKDGL